jgi:hypothetical protein
MYLRSVLMLPITAASVLTNYRIDGTNSYLVAAPLVPGKMVINDTYTHCEGLNANGEQVSGGEECFWNGLQYMIQALGDAHNDLQAVALLSNTVSGVESLPPTMTISNATNPIATISTYSLDSAPSAIGSISSKMKRQDGNLRQAFLDQLNDQILRRSQDWRGPRAVQISDSEVHPMDGLAIRTNVHSGASTLHVHTNGPHATAAFNKDVVLPPGRRNAVSMPGFRYRFQGTQGLKVQIQITAQEHYGMFGTLLSDLAHGKDEMTPTLKESDSWGFILCKKPENRILLRAKLIAEDDGAGYNWETMDQIRCNA